MKDNHKNKRRRLRILEYLLLGLVPTLEIIGLGGMIATTHYFHYSEPPRNVRFTRFEELKGSYFRLNDLIGDKEYQKFKKDLLEYRALKSDADFLERYEKDVRNSEERTNEEMKYILLSVGIAFTGLSLVIPASIIDRKIEER